MFAYVGGLYFFLRTTLNSVLKCLRVFFLVCFKYCRRSVCKSEGKGEGSLKDDDEAAVPSEQDTDKLSLLASLPSGYQRGTPATNSGNNG